MADKLTSVAFGVRSDLLRFDLGLVRFSLESICGFRCAKMFRGHDWNSFSSSSNLKRDRMAAEGFLVCAVLGARHRADGKQMAAHNTADRASAVSAHKDFPTSP